MGDLITNDPRRRPLNWIAGVALLGVIIAGVVIFRPSPTPHAQEHPVPQAPVSSASPDSNLPPPGFPKLVTKTGVQLYVGMYGDRGRDFERLDVDSRRMDAIAGLPTFPSVWLQMLPLTDGAVVATPRCRACDLAHGSTVYVVRDARVIRHFPTAGQVVIGVDNRSLWVSDQPGYVRRVDLIGQPIGAHYRLPSGSVPMAATIHGLLLSRGQNVVLWDPATGKGSAISGYLTSNAHTIVAIDHGLRVTNLRTGAVRTLPGRVTQGLAALSADGTLLALGRDDSFGVQHFVVVDMRSGESTDLGGFSSSDQAGFRWAGNTHWLVTSALQGTAQRRVMVAIWQPGMQRPAFVRNLPPNYYVLD
jgi:hypothetical protein